MVEDSKVTAAVWGPFDEFLIAGHENGGLSQYDILNVCAIYIGRWVWLLCVM